MFDFLFLADFDSIKHTSNFLFFMEAIHSNSPIIQDNLFFTSLHCNSEETSVDQTVVKRIQAWIFNVVSKS